MNPHDLSEYIYDDIILPENYHSVLIELLDENNFLKVKETLTRIGIKGRRFDPDSKRILYQSCHLLHKRGKYYIVHFKELFLLEGRQTTISEDDMNRRNSIALDLQRWNLIKIVNPIKEYKKSVAYAVISFSDKGNWELNPKYTVWSDRRRNQLGLCNAGRQ